MLIPPIRRNQPEQGIKSFFKHIGSIVETNNETEILFAWNRVQRVVGIVPMVMDLLKTGKNLHHFYRSLGGWPVSFEPYYFCNVTAKLDTTEFDQLMVSAVTLA